jgi:DNA-binding response OmpR family regulator
MKILVVEDNLELCENLREVFEHEGFVVDTAQDGDRALDLAFSSEYDVILLDIMLPKMSGWDVCANLRKEGISTPILMLTARDSVSDRIKGLDGGADDYLVKPFDLGELLARIRVLIRRSSINKLNSIAIGSVKLDIAKRIVSVKGKPIKMSKKEFDILEYLVRNAGIVLDRQKIIEHVWETGFEIYSNVVDVYIKYIRDKLKKYGVEDFIETVRGVGYRVRNNL